MSNGFVEKIKFFLGFDDEDQPKQANPAPITKTTSLKPISKKLDSREIKIVSPKSYNDASTVSEYLKNDIPVIVNFQYLTKVQTNRFIDFVSGTLYAINGSLAKLSDSLLLLTSEKTIINEEILRAGSSDDEDEKVKNEDENQ